MNDRPSEATVLVSEVRRRYMVNAPFHAQVHNLTNLIEAAYRDESGGDFTEEEKALVRMCVGVTLVHDDATFAGETPEKQARYSRRRDSSEFMIECAVCGYVAKGPEREAVRVNWNAHDCDSTPDRPAYPPDLIEAARLAGRIPCGSYQAENNPRAAADGICARSGCGHYMKDHP